MNEENVKLALLKRICQPPGEYKRKDIRNDLRWSINYKVGNTEYFEMQSDPINGSHTFCFANQKAPFMWRYPWVNMQHEYGHAWLCENVDTLFGFTDFSEIIARYSGRKGSIEYHVRYCILLVVDWFVEWLVYERFREPFRENARLINTECIRSYGGVTNDFSTLLYYAFALAQRDLYVISLNTKLPLRAPIVKRFKKVFMSAHPKNPSIDICKEMVNRIFRIGSELGGLEYDTKADFMTRKIVKMGKEKELRLWDIIITDF